MYFKLIILAFQNVIVLFKVYILLTVTLLYYPFHGTCQMHHPNDFIASQLNSFLFKYNNRILSLYFNVIYCLLQLGNLM